MEDREVPGVTLQEGPGVEELAVMRQETLAALREQHGNEHPVLETAVRAVWWREVPWVFERAAFGPAFRMFLRCAGWCQGGLKALPAAVGVF